MRLLLPYPKSRAKGFTLVELLAVIAIIAILAGLLIPTVGAVRTQAKRTQTRALFSQLSTACINYKSDYGFYPLFGQPEGNPDSALSLEDAGEDVYRTLTGYSYDGTTILKTPHRRLNSKARSYHSFSEQDFNGKAIIDAFGNTDIIVVLDTDYNGQIARQILTTSGPATHIDGASEDTFQPVTTSNIRQPVLIYSAGAGAGQEVTSWPYDK